MADIKPILVKARTRAATVFDEEIEVEGSWRAAGVF